MIKRMWNIACRVGVEEYLTVYVIKIFLDIQSLFYSFIFNYFFFFLIFVICFLIWISYLFPGIYTDI